MYQWTKARFANIKSNLWFNLAHAVAIAVLLDSIQTKKNHGHLNY